MKNTIVNFFNTISNSINVTPDVKDNPIAIFSNEANLYNLAVALDHAIEDNEFANDMAEFMEENMEKFNVTSEDIVASKNWLNVAKEINLPKFRFRFILRRLNDELKHALGTDKGSAVYEGKYRGKKFDKLFEEFMKWEDHALMHDTGDFNKIMSIGSVARIGNCAIDKLVDAHKLHPADAYQLRRKFDAWCINNEKPAHAIMHAARSLAREYHLYKHA